MAAYKASRDLHPLPFPRHTPFYPSTTSKAGATSSNPCKSTQKLSDPGAFALLLLPQLFIVLLPSYSPALSHLLQVASLVTCDPVFIALMSL